MAVEIARTVPRADIRTYPSVGSLNVPAPRPWSVERGEIHWEGLSDIAGGFPGYGECGGRLRRALLRVTDRYVLVDEGRSHGFGLPVDHLVGAMVVDPPSTKEPPVLRLTYQDGDLLRAFVVRPRGPLFRRGGARMERVLNALETAGVRRASDSRGLGVTAPTLSRAVLRFHPEPVIWSGRASAPIGSGLKRASVELSLSTRSLVWSHGRDTPIQRLPLDLVRCVTPGRLDDRSGTPIVYVASDGLDGVRDEVSFVFDAYRLRERNQRERGVFLTGLRSRGIGLGMAAPCRQPWRPTGRPTVRLVTVPDLPMAAASRAFAATVVEAPVAGSAEVTAVETTAHAFPLPVTTVPEMMDSAASDERVSTVEHVAAAPDLTAALLPQTRSYEAACLAVLTEVLSAVACRDAGEPSARIAAFPAGGQRQAALAELDAAVAAAVRRARLLALADAAPRLRSLVELRAAGYLSEADLRRKRHAILAPLASLIFGPTS